MYRYHVLIYLILLKNLEYSALVSQFYCDSNFEVTEHEGVYVVIYWVLPLILSVNTILKYKILIHCSFKTNSRLICNFFRRYAPFTYSSCLLVNSILIRLHCLIRGWELLGVKQSISKWGLYSEECLEKTPHYPKYLGNLSYRVRFTNKNAHSSQNGSSISIDPIHIDQLYEYCAVPTLCFIARCCIERVWERDGGI